MDKCKGGGKRLKSGILFMAVGGIFSLLGYAWYAVCMLGAIVWLLLSKEIQIRAGYKWIVKIVLLIIFCLCVRTGETNIEYVLKGLASFCLFVFIFYDKTTQRVLDNKIFKSLSQYSFEIYLVHTPVNLMVVSFVYGFLEHQGINHRLIVSCTYLIALGLSLLCSKALHVVANRAVKTIYDMVKPQEISEIYL